MENKSTTLKKETLKAKDGYITPSHYMFGKYETIEILREVLTPKQYWGFCCGFIIKYLTRATNETLERNLTKAKYYLDELINYDKEKEKVDNNRIHPSYYKKRNIETIDIIDDQLEEECLTGFYIGGIIKYVLRATHKHGLEDLEKAKYYLDRLLKYSNKKTK